MYSTLPPNKTNVHQNHLKLLSSPFITVVEDPESGNTGTPSRNKIPFWGRTDGHFAESKDLSPATTLSSSQVRLQEGTPTFIPSLENLRSLCLRHESEELLELERTISVLPPGPGREEQVRSAIHLLRQFDVDVARFIERTQYEDPEYASSRGVHVTHFSVGSGNEKAGNWVMLGSNWGKDNRSITEVDRSRLSDLHNERLEKFAGGKSNLEKVYFKRQKTLSERQPGSVIYSSNGVIEPVPRRILLWRILMLAATFALFVFLGVGIIATTSRFSTAFVKSFFIVAIVWTLVSSALLAWLVKALGGDKRDAVSAFLAAIATWLVVIQIGQTHLALQDPFAAGATGGSAVIIPK